MTLNSPRTELPIGTEPRLSNISAAPLCSSYAITPYYDDPRIDGDEPLPLPFASQNAQQRCTTVSGLIVDEGDKGLWKILTGDIQQAMYTGPHYPNSTTDEVSNRFVGHCGNGCLYELHSDPLETANLAASQPAKLKWLHEKLENYEKSAFNPDRGSTNAAACRHAKLKYAGFWGPFVR